MITIGDRTATRIIKKNVIIHGNKTAWQIPVSSKKKKKTLAYLVLEFEQVAAPSEHTKSRSKLPAVCLLCGYFGTYEAAHALHAAS